MPQLIDFATHHLPLVGAFLAVLGVLGATFLFGPKGLSPAGAVQLINQEEAVTVDIRPEKSFRAGHILNAVHINPSDMEAGANKLAKHRDKPVIVYCDNGMSCNEPVKALQRAGFARVYALQGGLSAWRGDNLPVQASR